MVMNLNALKQKEKGNAHGATSGQLERRHEPQLRSTHKSSTDEHRTSQTTKSHFYSLGGAFYLSAKPGSDSAPIYNPGADL